MTYDKVTNADLPRGTPEVPVTRSVRIGGVTTSSTTVTEIRKCDTEQFTIPNLPVPLRGHVGVVVNQIEILVCGGTDYIAQEFEALGDYEVHQQQTDYHKDHSSRNCLNHTLGSDKWDQAPYVMNEKRMNAHASLSANQVFVMGGSMNDHTENYCRMDEEVLDIQDTSKGWVRREITETAGDLCFHPSEVILSINCM